jgi:hypothetical protein
MPPNPALQRVQCAALLLGLGSPLKGAGPLSGVFVEAAVVVKAGYWLAPRVYYSDLQATPGTDHGHTDTKPRPDPQIPR